MAGPIKLEIAGRTFRALPPPKGSYEFEGWLLRNIYRDVRRGANEGPQEFAARVLGTVFTSEKLFFLLGALLIESTTRDEEWNTDMAQANADFFSTHSGPDDRRTLQQAAVALLSQFALTATLK